MMKRDAQRTRLATVVAAAGLALLAASLLAAPAGAQEEEKEEQRRVVKKIRIECDGDDCPEHGGHHGFTWFSGDHPRHFMFKSHRGGGFLGVMLAELTPELRTHFGVEESAGVMVSKVVEDSAAARAGVQVGDIITGVDGASIASGDELARSIRAQEAGTAVVLEVWRDGKVQSLTATVEEREADAHAMEHAFVLECDEDEQDCSFATRRLKAASDLDLELDCDGGPCEIEVRCDDSGDCDCTLNGEATDCSRVPGLDG